MNGWHFRVRDYRPRTVADLECDYDAVVGSLGYERRSRAIPEALSEVPLRAAPSFPTMQVGSFAANKAALRRRGWDLPSIDHEDEYASWFSDWLGYVVGQGGKRLAVDISSMSRARLASSIEIACRAGETQQMELDFLYTPAVFKKTRATQEPSVLSVAPVSSCFAGWWTDLDLPLYAIIGVGYELERASSAIDHLEPTVTEVYIPEGSDPKYLSSVLDANQALLRRSVTKRRSHYRVSDPFSCFRQLEASVHRLQESYRVALVPLGPKIFAVSSMLVAAGRGGNAQVIRVSGKEREVAVDRSSGGAVYGLTVAFRPTTSISGDQGDVRSNG